MFYHPSSPQQVQVKVNIGDDYGDRFQFARWGFHLKASVECFGKIAENENQPFFTCFSHKIRLREMWLHYKSPISVTTSYLITRIYSDYVANRDGVIFMLNERNGHDPTAKRPTFLDCRWISDYGHEECEQLLFDGGLDIHSVDLLGTKPLSNLSGPPPDSCAGLRGWMAVLKWWDIMTNIGKYPHFCNELGTEKERNLCTLLVRTAPLSPLRGRGTSNVSDIVSGHDMHHSHVVDPMMAVMVPSYVETLFGTLCGRKWLDVNLELLHGLLHDAKIRAHFIDRKDGRVDFWGLMALFPRATKFEIKLQNGLNVDSFICEKLLNALDRRLKVSSTPNALNTVILSSQRANKNFRHQTKQIEAKFRARKWMIFFPKTAKKVKFQKDMTALSPKNSSNSQ